MVRYGSICLSFIFCITFHLILAHGVMAGWVRIGLEDKKVTALVTAAVPGPDTLLIAGTETDGIWARKGNTGGFQLVPHFGSNDPVSFLAGVNKLHVDDSTHRLFAACDSGLFVYPLVTMIEPRWMNVAALSGTAVTDITGSGNTMFCCTAAEVYRSLDCGGTWTACSARTVPPPGNTPGFTSLAFYYGINAGSTFLDLSIPWQGVINSGDIGKTWRDISKLPPQTQAVGLVFDLASYRPAFNAVERMLAATKEGLYFIQGDLDTGYWHAFEPQLATAVPKSIHISLHSRSFIADYWIATDSGVFRLSSSTNQTWLKLFDQPAHCIIDDAWVDPKGWFAGTDDGVWQYTEEARIGKNTAAQKAGTLPGTASCFTLDGRIVHGSIKSAPHPGVLIIRENGNEKLFRRLAINR
jgi:hypothetical protein